MKHCFLIISLFFCFIHSAYAASSEILNIYTWAGEIPDAVIAQFEKETGIKVNYATFDSNEIMYAKLRTRKESGYDIVEPSNYYIQRMMHQNMLQKLDKTKLSFWNAIDPFFIHVPYDPDSDYSVPFVWGVTGLYYNQEYFNAFDITCWMDLMNKKFVHQLFLLDDAREVFAVALRMLGYSGNDTDPAHIKQAYKKLKKLLDNVKVFNTDAVLSILIDEDATAGMVWNADLYSAHQENSKLHFVFPSDHFTIWIDNLAILKNAPHVDNAYRFINFLMRPEIAKEVSLNIHYATTNTAAKALMPAAIQHNPMLYPPLDKLKNGELQLDIGDNAFALMEKYWEQLKMGG